MFYRGVLIILFFNLIGLQAAMSQGHRSRGVPANPKLAQVQQPDGKTIYLYGKGDGLLNWYQSKNGYTVIKNNDGYYVYANYNENGDLIPGKSIVSRFDDNQLISFIRRKPANDKNILFSPSQIESEVASYFKSASSAPAATFPSTGTNKVLLILIDFPDLPSTISRNSFEDLLNEEGYNGTGSYRDYYLESSYGMLDLQTTVTRWYQAAENMSYYGANNASGDDIRVNHLIREVLDSLETDGMDFSEFDNNNDGVVDGIQIIHAGYGEENTGISDEAIWSHRWTLDDKAVSYDGVFINDYAIYPEFDGASGVNITNIGIICHEFGHLLGLWDYYDVDYDLNGPEAFDLGEWDIMAGGLWNNNGATPAGNNAYSKYLLGWLNLTELSGPNSILLQNINESDEAYLIKTNTANEFFILENRQQVNFDAYIPHHGLIVYHIDKNYTGWVNNQINIDPLHQGLDLVEADNLLTEGSVSGDPFPGNNEITEFSDYTFPSMQSWALGNTNKPISNIREIGGVILFDFMGGADGYVTEFTALAVNSSQIALDWKLNNKKDSVLLAWNTSNTFGTPEVGQKYKKGDMLSGGGTIIYSGADSSFIHFELDSSTTYYYSIWSDTSTGYSGKVISLASTFCNTYILPYNQDFSDGTLPNCWQNISNNASNNTWHFNNPSGVDLNSPTKANGFILIDSDLYGNGSQDADLISPVFDLSGYDSVGISFAHNYRHNPGSTAKLYYSVNAGIDWTLLEVWNTSTSNTEIFERNVSAYVARQSKVRFKWNYTGSNDYYWALDDVQLVSNKLSDSKEIISFILDEQTSFAKINPIDSSIDINVHYLANTGSLKPLIKYSEGATIFPSDTLYNNFSDTATYTLTAQDGSTRDWNVYVHREPNKLALIDSVTLVEQAYPAIIYDSAHIHLRVLHGADVTRLSPVIYPSLRAKVLPESGTERDFTHPQQYLVIAEDSTLQFWDIEVSVQSDSNDIRNLKFEHQVGNEIIDTAMHTVDITVAYNIGLTALKPQISISDSAIINPIPELIRDFTFPQVYTVTSEIGTPQDWQVRVVQDSNNENRITSFKVDQQTVPEEIDTTNKLVVIHVVENTDLSSLTPHIQISDSAQIFPASNIARDFSDTVHYKVLAENGDSSIWSVLITTLPNDQNAITFFSVANQLGSSVINNDSLSIEAIVAFGTDIKALQPSIITSPLSKLSPDTNEVRDFSSPIEYMVVAENGDIALWTVHISIQRSTGKSILSFTLPNEAKPADIDTLNKRIVAYVPEETDLSNLTPTIDISDSATISPPGGISLDFTFKVDYTVTADDGSEQIWEARVLVHKSDIDYPRIEKLAIYPNPASDELIISNPENRQFDYFRIYSLTGQLLVNEIVRAQARYTFNLNLETGTYIIHLSGEEIVKALLLKVVRP